MNFKFTHIIVAALTACCLLNGCARGHSKEAVYQPIPPAQRVPGAQFTVQAVGDQPLFYQWYFNPGSTKGTQQSSVEASTNPPLNYQWYKNTNINDGSQH